MAKIVKRRLALKRETTLRTYSVGSSWASGDERRSFNVSLEDPEKDYSSLRIEFTLEEAARLKKYLNENF